MRKNLSLVTVAAFAVTLSTTAHAQWLTHTIVNPGLITNGTSFGGNPPGNVTSIATVLNDGGNDGVPGIVPGVNGTLTPSFLANYAPNGDGTLTFLNCGYNNTADSFFVTMDFSFFGSGYLPAGSTFAILDMDILENMERLQAVDTSFTTITTPWLSQYGGVKGLLDYDNSNGDQTGSVTAPTQIYGAGMYTFQGLVPNDTSALLGFQTTQDIVSISWLVNKGNASSAAPGGGGYGVAINAVPEPASMAVFGLGLAALAARRRRQAR